MDTPRGRVSSSWRRLGGLLALTVRVPGNTSAEIDVPVRDGGAVRLPGDAGVRYLRTENGYSIYAVDGGGHIFLAQQ